ncbi:MAG: TonB-dependent receptor [Spirochaetaceae bacterium]|jgi:outer membrane receptor protein involved in Fe transport|nr:TonB-dependent receptor [Spirochaetaceae bacterium]
MKKTFFQFDNIFLRMRMGICVAFLVCSFPVFSQDAGQAQDNQSSDTAVVEKPKTEEVVLPGAEVRAQKETAVHVTQEQMTERGDDNIMEAIRWVPGITITNGHPGMDSGSIALRGIGGSSGGGDGLELFVDGVPMTNIFDYRMDFPGILTGGFESLDIMKGYNSVLMGPNIYGGAMSLKSIKPKKEFELSARTGFDFDGGGFGGNTDSIIAGSRLGLFYAQASFNGRFIDHTRLSDSFKPYDDIAPEDGGDFQKKGNRLWSDFKTMSTNIMIGVNPIETLDIWATYGFTYTDKGLNPPAVNRTGVMAFPDDTRHTVTLHAEWTPEKFNLKFHGYFDKVDRSEPEFWISNKQNNWDAIQTWLNTGVAVDMLDFDQSVIGVNLLGGYTINDWNKIDATVQFKQVGEKKYDEENVKKVERIDANLEQDKTINYYYVGSEWTANPWKPFTAVLGLGIDVVDYQKHYTVNRPDPEMPTYVSPQWAVGLFYDLSEQNELYFTYAKKHHFLDFTESSNVLNGSGAMKPNPDLKQPERHNFEFGYKGYFLDKIRVGADVFMTYELNKVATVAIDPPDGAYTQQRQNVNKFLYYGIDFDTEIFLNDYFSVGGSLGVTKYKILEGKANVSGGVVTEWDYIAYMPQLTTNGYLTISPFAGKDTGIFKNIKVIPRFEYVSSFYETSGAASQDMATGQSTLIDARALVHLRISTDIAEHYSVSFAIENITDELYYVSRYYPGQGRSFNISLGAKF